MDEIILAGVAGVIVYGIILVLRGSSMSCLPWRYCSRFVLVTMPLMSEREQTQFHFIATDSGAMRPRAIIHGDSQMFLTDLDKFNALAQAWRDDSIGDAIHDFQHAAYHGIIGMGPAALPFIMDRLQQNEPGWIYALKCITGEIIGAGLRGDDVIATWIDWGRSKGIIGGRI